MTTTLDPPTLPDRIVYADTRTGRRKDLIHTACMVGGASAAAAAVGFGLWAAGLASPTLAAVCGGALMLAICCVAVAVLLGQPLHPGTTFTVTDEQADQLAPPAALIYVGYDR
jgi:ABC-type cobalamin transport system permease subunit